MRIDETKFKLSTLFMLLLLKGGTYSWTNEVMSFEERLCENSNHFKKDFNQIFWLFGGWWTQAKILQVRSTTTTIYFKGSISHLKLFYNTASLIFSQNYLWKLHNVKSPSSENIISCGSHWRKNYLIFYEQNSFIIPKESIVPFYL